MEDCFGNTGIWAVSSDLTMRQAQSFLAAGCYLASGKRYNWLISGGALQPPPHTHPTSIIARSHHTCMVRCMASSGSSRRSSCWIVMSGLRLVPCCTRLAIGESICSCVCYPPSPQRDAPIARCARFYHDTFHFIPNHRVPLRPNPSDSRSEIEESDRKGENARS